jgi:adenylosuccinate synthase
MRKVYFVAGLGFGDEGKGTIVDALVAKTQAPLVVRYNGGAQAAHHVVTEDGRSHCFAQFGSGTLHGAVTFLSRFVIVDPPAVHREAEHLRREFEIEDPVRTRLVIDPRAPVVTPYHRAMNQLREIARGAARHGSCGRGIGEVASDIAKHQPVLSVGELLQGKKTYAILKDIQARLWAEAQALRFDSIVHPAWMLMRTDPKEWYLQCHHDLYGVTLASEPWSVDRRPLVFEGAQGVLLDEWHGFHPYTTWSTTTFANAYTVFHESFSGHGEVTTIGVTRSFLTRHGAGPFPTDDPTLRTLIEDDHNKTNPWQEAFRPGHLDLALLRYAVEVAGPVSMLAVTHLDKLGLVRNWLVSKGYGNVPDGYPQSNYGHDLSSREATITSRLFNAQPFYRSILDGVPELLDILGAIAPVGIASFGQKASDKAFQGF